MGKPRKKPLVVPTTEQVEALLRSFSKAPTSVRNRAMVGLIWRCGLRASEAVALLPADLDAARGVLVVRRGKGAKSRAVGVDSGALGLVDQWLEARRRIRGAGPRAPLFCTLDAEPVSTSYLRSMLIRKAKKLDLPHLHPHALRHARAVAMMREGHPAAVIQKTLGHSSLATTGLYLDSLGAEDVVAALRDSTWRLPA